MIHWQEVPFIRLLFPLIIGILFSSEGNWSVDSLSIFLQIACILFLMLLLMHRQKMSYGKRHWFGILLTCFFLLIGVLSWPLQNPDFHKKYFAHHTSTSDFYLLLVEDQKLSQSGKNNRLLATVLGIGQRPEEMKKVRGEVVVYLPAHLLISAGDFLLVNAELKPIASPQNPLSFDYARYMRLQGIEYQLLVKEGKLVKLEWEDYFSMNLCFLKWRNKLQSHFQNHFDPVKAGLLEALVLGQKNNLDSELKSQYTDAGAMHVLAVSGMHVGIIAMGIATLLGFFPFRGKQQGWIKACISAGVIFAFAILTGAAPSVRRAALMFGLLVLGKQLHRQLNIWNVLGASALLMLLYNCRSLYMVGFQLSYFAVASIVYFQPKIYRLWLIKNPWLDYCWQLLALGIAAQIGTAPLSIFYFHQFPIFFWLSGVVVVPLATLTLLLGIAFLLFQSIPLLGWILAKLLAFVVELMNISMGFFADLPGATLENLTLSFQSLLFAYTLIFLFALWIHFHSWRIAFVTIIFSTLLMLQQFKEEQHKNDQLIIAFYKLREHTIVEFVEGQHSTTFVTDSLGLKKASFAQSAFHHRYSIRKKEAIFLKEKAYHLDYHGEQILIDGLKNDLNHSSWDCLVLRKSSQTHFVRQLSAQTKFVIIDSSVPFKKARLWADILRSKNINYCNLHQSGGLIFYLNT